MNKEFPNAISRHSRAAAATLVLALVCGPPTLGQDGARSGFELMGNLSGRPVPKGENGYIVGFEAGPKPAPLVYAYTTSGALLFERPLALLEVYEVIPRAMAASANGNFAVSGSAYSRGEGVNFIAFLDNAGKLRRVVRLHQFAARRLAYARDGRLWAAGAAVIYPQPGDEPDHDIIRVFDGEGNPQSSSLRKSEFQSGAWQHPARQSMLAGNRDSMAFLSVHHRELVLFSLDGKVVSRHRFDPLGEQILVTGFSLAPDSSIYLSVQVGKAGGAGERVVFWKWNWASGQWDQIYTRDVPSEGGYHSIFGFNEAGQMLACTRLPRFEWVTPMR